MSSNDRFRHACAALLLAAAACSADQPADEPAQATPPGPGPTAPDVAAQTGAQRLTTTQYRNAIRDLFGESVVVPAALEPDTTLDGFVAVGASVSTVSHRGIEQYEQAAYTIAEQAMADAAVRAAIIPCTTADTACADAFVSSFGRRVWRRPLKREEGARVTSVILKAAKTLGDFDQGLEFGLATLLQSPSFLYRAQVGEPDPEKPGKRRYTGYEMAARLSFFFWNSTPDDALLDAAKAGELTTDAGVDAQARRLLESPRARDGLRNFVTEWLGLAELDVLAKDPTLFTYYSPEVGPAAREETLRGFEHLAFDLDGDYRDIFTTKHTFVNPKLASMYAVAAPSPDGFGEVVFPDSSPRRGLLGQISILSLYAHPTSSSATLRGKFVRTRLLCAEIPPPPVNVNTALPEPSADAKTLRERVKVHLTDPVCAGCHLQMDPIGLGLENFDGIGRFRAKDNGAVIDATGDLDGARFVDARDLGARVREHPGVVPCLVQKMYEYATSYVETPAELATLDALTYDFRASGHRMKTLMLDIARSPAFRLAGDPQ